MSTDIRGLDVIPRPDRMKRLPVDKHGRVIPWFVHIKPDGTPDHRVIRHGGLGDALRFKVCWLCGQPRGAWAAFPIGPMCGMNRISSEPPSHRDCAVYAVRVCPFLATPNMVRRTTGLPEDRHFAPGIVELRNPGVTAVWITRDWEPVRVDDGMLFKLGEPQEILWFARGRGATRAEVRASIEDGLPRLLAIAEQGGKDAVEDTFRQRDHLLTQLPLS